MFNKSNSRNSSWWLIYVEQQIGTKNTFMAGKPLAIQEGKYLKLAYRKM